MHYNCEILYCFYIYRLLYYTVVRIEWIIVLPLSGSANKRPNKLKHKQFFMTLLMQFISPWIYTLAAFGVCIFLEVFAFAQYDHMLFMCCWLSPLFSRFLRIDGLRDYYCRVCSSSCEFYDCSCVSACKSIRGIHQHRLLLDMCILIRVDNYLFNHVICTNNLKNRICFPKSVFTIGFCTFIFNRYKLNIYVYIF